MQFDFTADDLIASKNYGEQGQPHDAWTQLRRHAPVWRCESSEFPPFWAITRHADIVQISSRPQVFSNAKGPSLISFEQEKRRVADSTAFANMKTIIEMDPPMHREFRKVASASFTPRRIHRLDDIVTTCAREQVDKLGREGETDFVESIAQRHPLRVLATLLGVEREDEELMLRLTQELFGSEDPDLQRKGEDRKAATAALGADFVRLFTRIIEDRRANPRDDLASMLANAKMDDGSPMPPIETYGYFLIVFTAGHDTTRNAIASGMQALLENPDQLDKLCKDPSLARSTVEEVVRWTTPVNYMKRVLLDDAEIRGVKLRKGEEIAMFYGSANRDEDVFDDPFRFDVTRHPNPHLGFGTGEHFCLGAHVARLSSRALFLELARRIESIELVGASRHIASSFVVGLKNLPIRYRLRPAA
ncbi:MAG: cytochrome P450 [Myxococcota bacterium]